MSTRSICAIVWNFLNIAQKCCRRMSWLRSWSMHPKAKFEALPFFGVLVGFSNNSNWLVRFLATAHSTISIILSSTEHHERYYLYLIISVTIGVLLCLIIITGRIIIQKQQDDADESSKDEPKFHKSNTGETTITKGFSGDNICDMEGGDIDLTTPMGMNSLPVKNEVIVMSLPKAAVRRTECRAKSRFRWWMSLRYLSPQLCLLWWMGRHVWAAKLTVAIARRRVGVFHFPTISVKSRFDLDITGFLTLKWLLFGGNLDCSFGKPHDPAYLSPSSWLRDWRIFRSPFLTLFLSFLVPLIRSRRSTRTRHHSRPTSASCQRVHPHY